MSSVETLIPVQRYTRHSGTFRWPAKVVLAGVRTADVLPLKQLAGDLKRQGKRRVRLIRDAASPATVRLRRDESIEHPEGYRLTIAADGIEIVAAGDAGAYYGVQTLRDLIAAGGATLAGARIDDWPDFARRGVYHDCARGKVPTVETVKALVERLARWKINELQLYIENTFRFRGHPKIGRGFSPLTAEEVLELQEHCKLHHVRLVGSLASFGHMEKILALPAYRHLGELPGTHGYPGGTTLCPTDPGAIELMTNLFGEFLPLFEATDFNICCDETWELGKGRSKARADRIGVGRVYLEFLLKLHGLCETHGKRTNAWADIVLQHPELLAELPGEIVMLNWDYGAHGKRIPRSKEIVKADLPLVVCPGTSSWQRHATGLANAIANVSSFAAEGRRCRADGLLNTDWGDCGHRNLLGVSLHGFAHGAAHAWAGRGVDDRRFTETFCARVFGDRNGRLAAAVRAAGSTHQTLGNRPYHMLVEPIDPQQDFNQALWAGLPVRARKGGIDEGPRGDLCKTISRLSPRGLWPPVPNGLDRFEDLALQEYTLACRMDVLACRRALAARTIRSGRTVPKAERRRLADDLRQMAGDFKRLWLARSKPSRLAENLKLFDLARRDVLEA